MKDNDLGPSKSATAATELSDYGIIPYMIQRYDYVGDYDR